MSRRADAPCVLVTGATGNVGREVVRCLLDRGACVRAAVRPGSTARLDAATETVPFDFGAESTFDAALCGVDAVFLMRPPAMSDPGEMRPFVRAMSVAGVRHVVFLSLMGAERNPVVPHFRIERMIRASNVPHTFLRPGFFMQNLSTTHCADIRDRGEVFVPAGNGRTSFVDARDVGEAAAIVLDEPGHQGRAYTLTGSEALTYDDVASALCHATGRHVRYVSPSGRAFAARMRAAGHPPELVTVMRGIYAVARLGRAGRVTGELERLLGRPPRTFADFARDHVACFIPAGDANAAGR